MHSTHWVAMQFKIHDNQMKTPKAISGFVLSIIVNIIRNGLFVQRLIDDGLKKLEQQPVDGHTLYTTPIARREAC